MMHLLQTIEKTAARGAEGLTHEAGQNMAAALQALQCPDGGFAGLDGRSDPYFSLFAWLSLRALGATYDRDQLCAYLTAHRPSAKRIDAQCANLVLAGEGCGVRFSRMKLVGALWRGDTREMYSAFMLVLATRSVPRWLAQIAWQRQRRLFASGAAERLPTPRLAAGVVLATLAGRSYANLNSALVSRQRADGGFASAAGAPADLLATAVARFALGMRHAAHGKECAKDLAFIEACWQDSSLFGPSPRTDKGDAEHTFYGLLALGTCRS